MSGARYIELSRGTALVCFTDNKSVYEDLNTKRNIEAIKDARKQHDVEYWRKFTRKDRNDGESYLSSTTRFTARKSGAGEDEVSIVSTPPSENQVRLGMGSFATKWVIENGSFRLADALATPAPSQGLRPVRSTRADRSPSPLREVSKTDSTGWRPYRR